MAFFKGSSNKSHSTSWTIIILIFLVIITISGLATGGIIWHRQPGFCTLCHTPMKNYVSSYFSGDTTLMIAKHALADTVKLKCLDCHTSMLSEQLREGANWITGNYTYPLEKRLFGTRSLCMSSGCHVESDIIKATEKHDKSLYAYNQHDSRHGKQECYTCHSIHNESVLTCNQCHKFELPTGWISPQPNGMITSSKE